MQRIFAIIIIILLIVAVQAGKAQAISNSHFNNAKNAQENAFSAPWSRWWWMGNAVNETVITHLLKTYKEAGIGGVEICPIYGVKGYEDQFIPFLSERWFQVYNHTISVVRKLNIGIDLTTGTGWPFGGPWITSKYASKAIKFDSVTVSPNERLIMPIGSDWISIIAIQKNSDRRIFLNSYVENDTLKWQTDRNYWTIFIFKQQAPIQRVKRAAPGGEGWVIDPYSEDAIRYYLSYFDSLWTLYQGKKPRAFFHDSFEYFGATWTSDLPEVFERRHGYSLLYWLPELFGFGKPDTIARVRHDYRETLGALHEKYIQYWTSWCHKHGSLARNQAHGAPSNLLDLYAIADIPETESFREIDEQQLPMLKIASSAANLRGLNLVSAEAFTWLGEHFKVTLRDLKEAADWLFLGGINHLIYHGIAYSPPHESFPGWLFYASVDLAPQAGLWADLSVFNKYVERVQRYLQTGFFDNDILLYIPWHDFWSDLGDSPLRLFTMHNQPEWFWKHSVYQIAQYLIGNGYSFDFISDKWLDSVRVENGKLYISSDGMYHAIIIPSLKYIPVSTLVRLKQLTNQGATVLFAGSRLPNDVPGLSFLHERREELHRLLENLSWTSQEYLKIAKIGKGKWIQGEKLEHLLNLLELPKEDMNNYGLRFIRKRFENGWFYFIVNKSSHSINAWIPINKPVNVKDVFLEDPETGYKGRAAFLKKNDNIEVFLQLEPGKSIILFATTTEVSNQIDDWFYWNPVDTLYIRRPWTVTFVQGGPALPTSVVMDSLISWTEIRDTTAHWFHGTAEYEIYFSKPDKSADEWLLDLGDLYESAEVWINDKYVGTVWHPPYRLFVGRFLDSDSNKIVIKVTNSPQNYIVFLDRYKFEWKKFYDINFVNREYQPFDASHWTLKVSGLLGPVRLIRVEAGKE